MEKKNYKEKLLDPRWQRKRLEIFERDEWMCTGCIRGDKTLHVHHLDYLPNRDPWDYPNEYLITLCEDCHASITDFLPAATKDIISQLKIKCKNQFNLSCVREVVNSYEDLDQLFYLLWEARKNQEKVFDLLSSIE